ncbi:MAG: hypothetical protein AAFQ63_15845 [Cyanobacteria bacterium J06621_11]
MTISTTDADIQKADMLKVSAARTHAQSLVYQSTGSKLLDSLYYHNTLSTTTALFREDAANGLGLQHLEIPSLQSTPLRKACTVKEAVQETARDQAVARLANILKQDRNKIAKG